MTAPKVTQEQFIKDVDEFFKWVSPLDKSKTSWLLSLENWAKWQYETASPEEKETD